MGQYVFRTPEEVVAMFWNLCAQQGTMPGFKYNFNYLPSSPQTPITFGFATEQPPSVRGTPVELTGVDNIVQYISTLGWTVQGEHPSWGSLAIVRAIRHTHENTKHT